jgi:hypothetical protein
MDSSTRREVAASRQLKRLLTLLDQFIVPARKVDIQGHISVVED